MADISKIQIESGTYNIKDSTARTNIGDLANLNTSVNTNIVNAINSILANQDVIAGANSLPQGTKFYLLAGTIRQDENNTNSWYLLDDTNHKKIGLSNVVVENNIYLRLNYDQEYDKVITLLCGPDENLAALNVTCGASVGLGYSLISLGCKYDSWGEIYYDGTNWVDSNGGTLTFSNGVLTLTPSNTLNLFNGSYGVQCECISRGYSTYKNVVKMYSGIRFCAFDSSGNRVTTPTTDIAFDYKLWHNGILYLNNKMPTGSNVWIIGIMAKYPDNYVAE